MLRSIPRHLALVVGLGLLAAACGSGGDVPRGPPPVPRPAGDLLEGGNFAPYDATRWHLSTVGDATLESVACDDFDGDCVVVSGDDYGNEPYSTQLVYWDDENDRARLVSLAPGAYRLHARVRASSGGRSVQVVIQDASYRVVQSLAIAPTRSSGNYETEPFMVLAGTQVTFKVNLGGAANAGATFSLDDLYLVRDGDFVAAPTFSPSGGTFEVAQTVTISTTTAGASIYYEMTEDGSEPPVPTTASTPYTGQITLAQPPNPGTFNRYRFKAIAVAEGLTNSLVVSADYRINNQAPGVDLLAGVGSFDTAAQQGEWYVNVPTGAGSTAATDPTLAFESCAGFTGSCARVSSSNYGSDSWHTQLAYGSAGTSKTVTLRRDGRYRISFKARIDSPDNGPRNVSIWMQMPTGGWPPYVNTGNIALSTTATDYQTAIITPNASAGDFRPPPDGTNATEVQATFVINLGPDATNAGVTFYFDDIQIVDVDAAPPAALVLDFEGDAIDTVYDEVGWLDADITATVVDDPVAPGTGNNVLRVVNINYNAAPVISLVIPDGKTLGDYNSFTFKGHFASGDVGWKHVLVYAFDAVPTGQFGNSGTPIGDYNRDRGASAAFEDITVDISANTSTFTGTVYFTFGISNSGATWYADDVTLAE